MAAGGDGMLASIAGPVVDAGGTLGIVPSGRGNDFARMLGLVGARAEARPWRGRCWSRSPPPST